MMLLDIESEVKHLNRMIDTTVTTLMVFGGEISGLCIRS